jgi:P4 family phage/plasmid primase-like protien
LEYDPGADCPTYAEHISETLMGNETAIALFDEFAALTLVPDMRYQKALYLVGEGGSGKSTLLKAVELMHDPNAISVTPLDKIDDERYLTNLARKLVCISFDIQTRRKVFGESFIRITGGDPVTTRELYKEVEGRVVPTVRFLGSMNPDMPSFIASPDALERRLILLPCGKRVLRPDPNRFVRIRAERAGILARWVHALRRLHQRGHFVIPDESALELADYIHGQDPFDLFVAEKVEVDSAAKTPVIEITREYNWWAQDVGAAQLDVNVVGRKLRRSGITGGFARVASEQGIQNVRVVHARMRRERPRQTF